MSKFEMEVSECVSDPRCPDCGADVDENCVGDALDCPRLGTGSYDTMNKESDQAAFWACIIFGGPIFLYLTAMLIAWPLGCVWHYHHRVPGIVQVCHG